MSGIHNAPDDPRRLCPFPTGPHPDPADLCLGISLYRRVCDALTMADTFPGHHGHSCTGLDGSDLAAKCGHAHPDCRQSSLVALYPPLAGPEYKFNRIWIARNDDRFTFRDQVKDNMFWSLTSGVTIWTL